MEVLVLVATAQATEPLSAADFQIRGSLQNTQKA
jgi:hypothetical protein